MLPALSRCSGIKEEEGNSSDGTYFRGCKRIRWETIPEKILFEILLRVPAQDIYYASRFVCKKWNRVTSDKDFIQKHLEHSSYGLLYMDASGSFAFLQVGAGGGIETYKLRYNLLEHTCFFTSCNGLMLRHDMGIPQTRYYVTNISTNHAALLLHSYPWDARYSLGYCGIAFDASSMKYKVIFPCTGKEYGHALAILTVGKGESWRMLYVDDPPRLNKSQFVVPFVTEGFVHWSLYSDNVVATLDLATEKIARTPAPVDLRPLRSYLLSTGRSLTLFHRSEAGNWAWQVFEMKPDTREWNELSNICLDGDRERSRIKELGFEHDEVEIKPCSWLKYPEVLALRINRGFIIFYNFITREIRPEKVSLFQHCFQVAFHKNSLICPPVSI